jgi:hypothetical protein
MRGGLVSCGSMIEPQKATFTELANRWTKETSEIASPTRRFMHPDYQRIIGMGQPALPWLIERLRNQPDDWFWALAAITGDVPLPDDFGFESARRAWLNWGAAQGY